MEISQEEGLLKVLHIRHFVPPSTETPTFASDILAKSRINKANSKNLAKFNKRSHFEHTELLLRGMIETRLHL